MKTTGVPAFPGPAQHEQRTDIHEGMTLRDYFAAKALPIAWDAFDKGYFSDADYNAAVVKCAYQIADAMLMERERK